MQSYRVFRKSCVFSQTDIAEGRVERTAKKSEEEPSRLIILNQYMCILKQKPQQNLDIYEHLEIFSALPQKRKLVGRKLCIAIFN